MEWSVLFVVAVKSKHHHTVQIPVIQESNFCQNLDSPSREP